MKDLALCCRSGKLERSLSPQRQLFAAVVISLVVAMASHYVAGHLTPASEMWMPGESRSLEKGKKRDGTTVEIDFRRVRFYIVRETAVFMVVYVLMYWGIGRVKRLFFDRDSNNHASCVCYKLHLENDSIVDEQTDVI